MDWNGKTVLVTGGNGFIGSHLIQLLLERGARVYTTVRNPAHVPYLDNLHLTKRITIQDLDIRELRDVAAFVEKNQFDCIFHLASQADTWKAQRMVRETFDVNVRGTINLLHAIAEHAPTTRMIMLGSVGAFPSATPTKLNPYDASKQEAEKAALYYSQTRALDIRVVRNTNTYGPNDLNFNRLVPSTLKGIIVDHRLKLKGDGTTRRDFLYVGDVANGIRCAAEVEKKGTYTLTSGERPPVRMIVETLAACAPTPVPIEWETRTSLGERDQTQAISGENDPSFTWKPTMTLNEGLRHTYEWYAHHFQEKKNI